MPPPLTVRIPESAIPVGFLDHIIPLWLVKGFPAMWKPEQNGEVMTADGPIEFHAGLTCDGRHVVAQMPDLNEEGMCKLYRVEIQEVVMSMVRTAVESQGSGATSICIEQANAVDLAKQAIGVLVQTIEEISIPGSSSDCQLTDAMLAARSAIDALGQLLKHPRPVTGSPTPDQIDLPMEESRDFTDNPPGAALGGG